MNDRSIKKVAILRATYNGILYVREFLESLCRQNFKDFRIYVRDDGSTDGTVSVIAEYENQLDIRLLPVLERLGAAQSFLRLLEEAEGGHDYYLFADQDDVWYGEKIQRAVTALQGRQDEVLLYCSKQEYVDKSLRHLGYSREPKLLIFENAIVQNIATGCTVAITSQARRDVLTSKPRHVLMHDWWLYMYCSAFGHVIYDPRPSLQYRQHGANTIGAATNWLDDFHRRWARFKRRDAGVYRLSDQAKEFESCYGKNLQDSQRKILKRVLAGKKSWTARIGLATFLPVSRQTWVDNWIMRVLFLLGRY
ncbi:glycosyltransferase family 2 protein [Leptospira sp. SA-E8]|uniref:glycosyltransferase family 2 protein n=1 Tax=Leptospira sp. SA-E8 TaxID=3422259 RepID=UPI003EBDF651